MDSIFKRYDCRMPYLDRNELRSLNNSPIPYETPKRNKLSSLNKVPIPHESPKGVSDFNAFENNVLYENTRSDHVFKLIENLEWDKAIVQLKGNKHLAEHWIINNGKRRLPIHEACARQPSTEIIFALLDIYPDGAKAKDSSGRYSIHHACVQGASASTVCQLLYTFPEGADVSDNLGKTPKIYALDAVTPDVEVIKTLFHKSHYDIANIVFSIKNNQAASSTQYDNYYNTEKCRQLVLSPTKPVSTFHMVPLENTLKQTSTNAYPTHTQRDAPGQIVEEEGDRSSYLSSLCLKAKREDIRVSQNIAEVDPKQDIGYTQMGQLQHGSRRIVNAMSAFNSKTPAGHAKLARFQHEVDELKSQVSRPVKNIDLVSTERDNALRKVARLEKKIIDLESKVQDSRRLKERIIKKDDENDLLRSINKDGRRTVISLTRKLNTVMKDLEEVRKNAPASDELVGEVKRLEQYSHIAEDKIQDLTSKNYAHSKMIDKLSAKLEYMSSSYRDIANALVVKSKDLCMLKGELNQRRGNQY